MSEAAIGSLAEFMEAKRAELTKIFADARRDVPGPPHQTHQAPDGEVGSSELVALEGQAYPTRHKAAAAAAAKATTERCEAMVLGGRPDPKRPKPCSRLEDCPDPKRLKASLKD